MQLKAATTLKDAIYDHATILDNALSRSQRRSAVSFTQAHDVYIDGRPVIYTTEPLKLGEVVNVLTRVKDELGKY